MSISLETILPAQPPAGEIQFVPLGGDGWTSPQSVYFLNWQSTGDASGGTHQLRVSRDERFEQIGAYLGFRAVGVTPRVIRFDAAVAEVVQAEHIGTAVVDATINTLMYVPPLLINTTSWTIRTTNNDTEVITFRGMIYNFNVRASERVPLHILLASFPRSPVSL